MTLYVGNYINWTDRNDIMFLSKAYLVQCTRKEFRVGKEINAICIVYNLFGANLHILD